MTDLFAGIEPGVRIPGGCDDCDAYQVLDDSDAPLYMLRVYHDDTCPYLQEHERKKRKQARP